MNPRTRALGAEEPLGALHARTTLTEQILVRLRTAIVDGELIPGTRYSATGLGERFGVSRTPVREALLELERDGLVRIDKNRGVSIVATSLDEVVECFQVRLLLEVPAAARAARSADRESITAVEHRFAAMERAAHDDDPERLLRADRDFHQAILVIADNARLVKVLQDLRNLVLTTGVATVPASRSCQELVEDHREILEALRRGDSAASARAMHRHIVNTATLLIRREATQRREGGGQDGQSTGHHRPSDIETLTDKLHSFDELRQM